MVREVATGDVEKTSVVCRPNIPFLHSLVQSKTLTPKLGVVACTSEADIGCGGQSVVASHNNRVCKFQASEGGGRVRLTSELLPHMYVPSHHTNMRVEGFVTPIGSVKAERGKHPVDERTKPNRGFK